MDYESMAHIAIHALQTISEQSESEEIRAMADEALERCYGEG